MKNVDAAKEKFGKLIFSELERIEDIKEQQEFIDFKKLDRIIIGIAPGDGIGPIIIKQARRVLNLLLKDAIRSGRVELREIEGLTIENRSAKMQSVPDDVLAEIKKCHVILKGPSTTPRATDPWPNLRSANATLRKELDLFANVRPVCIPEKGIDWTFYRENIEGAYIWGNKGIHVNDDLDIDFVVETSFGSERIARAAFEFAKNNGKTNVTVVTKANIVKLTDGNFISACKKVSKDYPGITLEERFVDATAAKLADPEFNQGLQVFVLPNLYGDIITDIAAELQGGLGTAGSANIGTRYAVFEAIHGSAPFLMSHNRGEYADPSSILRATAMLLSYIGYKKQSEKLTKALNICGIEERKIVITSLRKDASTEEYGDYVIETIEKLGDI
ncbi:MAG TPA: isocitrate dehydrogenase [Clostridium sp.]|jgi:isocitrate dehydrogenase (NAD+)|nr:isocitrate dehydrogenase [Clostridium sp.]